MCGIAGYLEQSGKRAKKAAAEQMLMKLIHRGPDDSDTWSFDNVALGYNRLSILDLSDNGNQPFLTADGNGVLVYNGEVYNYRQLRKELEAEGITFISDCDTEVVLYALHIWGPEQAVQKFNGMFAFAYYDLRSRKLWLGRDRAGIKPLYIARSNGVLAFASEMKALFEHPSIPCRPDMHALTTHILHQRLDGWTPFENVQELQPGRLLSISGDKEKEIVYFDLLRDLDVDRIIRGDDTGFDTWLSRLENLFPKCVESHLISDVPLAAMCSGGVDSSLMTALALQNKPDLVAYVADVEGLEESETDRARRACNHLGIDLRVVPVDRKDFMQRWPVAAYHNGEPNFFKQNVPYLAIAEAAHHDGFKILLAGEGADELFGGYSWQGQTYEMWKKRQTRSRFLPKSKPFRSIAKKLIRLLMLSMDNLEAEPFRGLSSYLPSGNPDARRIATIDAGKRIFRQRALFEKLSPFEKIEERAFLARSFDDFYLHLNSLLKCNDKMTMAYSIETRVPFLDTRMIEFGLHLPAKVKYANGISKPLLRRAASRHLPHDLMHKKKIGFGVSDNVWRDTTEFLKNGWVEDMFKWSSEDQKQIRELIKNDSSAAFHLVSLEIWAQIYFNSEKPQDITEKLLAMENISSM